MCFSSRDALLCLLIFCLLFPHLLFLLLHLPRHAKRKRRCPVICLDHQIKPSVRSAFLHSVTSPLTICLLTKRRRRRPLLCLSTPSLHILLAQSGGFKPDQVVICLLFFGCFYFCVLLKLQSFRVFVFLVLLFLLLPSSWKMIRLSRLFWYPLSFQRSDLMWLFVARKVSEQWWRQRQWQRQGRWCVL